MMLSLVLVLFLGSTWCHGWRPLRFPDGEADGSSENFNTLSIQEGAIIDIVCTDFESFGGNLYAAYYDILFEYLYNFNYFDLWWTLASSVDGNRLDGDTWGAAEVDGNTFPNDENWEVYNRYWTYDEPSAFWNKPRTARHLSTIRYTARIEDSDKFLFCRNKVLGYHLDQQTGPGVKLVIRPGPAPLTYHSSVLHKWRGGFVGEIHVPISDYYNSWKMVLEFPKKVYSLKGGHFQVANEPCLHGPDCGDDRKKTWVIYNTFNNRVQNPGDELHLIFVASTWKKVDRGLKAKVHFYGYSQVYHAEGEPESSSSDIHIKFSSSSSSSSSEEPEIADVA